MSTKKMMHALAVGPRELFSGLAAFGVEIRHATSKDEAIAVVTEVRSIQSQKPYAIIFIAESLTAEMNENEYAMVMGEDLPVVLTVPDLLSNEDAGLQKLRSLTKRAVGVDIFAKE